MSAELRNPTAADVPAIGKLVFDAFASIHDRHNFPRDFPQQQMAEGFMQAWVTHPKIWGVVAEQCGKIVGCNFLDERDAIAGVGPVCVDPTFQGHGVGKLVMRAVLDRAECINARGVRLLQDAFNTTSMSLYASHGFDVREPIAVMTGKVAHPAAPGLRNSVARAMRESDLLDCADLCRRVHGFERTGFLTDALRAFKPFVLERDGQLTAYTAAPTFWPLNHGVAESPEDAMALLAGVSSQISDPMSLLVPTRNASFFRWCLSQKLRMLKPMTLMTLGSYEDPKGWWCPSVLY
jgi:predicted N-acetyltransferase YhbS